MPPKALFLFTFTKWFIGTINIDWKRKEFFFFFFLHFLWIEMSGTIISGGCGWYFSRGKPKEVIRWRYQSILLPQYVSMSKQKKKKKRNSLSSFANPDLVFGFAFTKGRQKDSHTSSVLADARFYEIFNAVLSRFAKRVAAQQINVNLWSGRAPVDHKSRAGPASAYRYCLSFPRLAMDAVASLATRHPLLLRKKKRI